MGEQPRYWALPVNGNLQTQNAMQYKNTPPEETLHLKGSNPLELTEEEKHMSGDAFVNSLNEHVKPKASEQGLIVSVSEKELKELSPQSANSMAHYILDYIKYKDLGILPEETEFEFNNLTNNRYEFRNLNNRIFIHNTTNSNHVLNSSGLTEAVQKTGLDVKRRFLEMAILHEGIHGAIAEQSSNGFQFEKGVPFKEQFKKDITLIGNLSEMAEKIKTDVAPIYQSILEKIQREMGETSIDFVSNYLTDYHEYSNEELFTTGSEMIQLYRLSQTEATPKMAEALDLPIEKVQALIDEVVGKPFDEKEVAFVKSLEESFKEHMPVVHEMNERIAKNWEDVVITLLHWAIKPGGLNTVV